MRTLRLISAMLPFVLTGLAQDGSSTVLVWTGGPRAASARLSAGARKFGSLPLAAARVTRRERAALEAELGPGHVFEDREYRTSLLPAVPVSGAPYLWDAGYTGRSQAVAIIDTGINAQHPAFLGVNVIARVFLNSGRFHECFGDDASTANDLQGHGTRTASIVAGQGAPLFPGYFGAARGAGTVYSMKAGFRARAGSSCPAADGILLSSDIVAAMDDVVRNTAAKVVNLSLGVAAEADDDVLSRVFDYVAEQYSITMVFAAGNRGSEASISTPGIAYNGITVANMDDKGTEDKRDDAIHPSSTRGPTPGLRNKPDLAAPGTRIFAAEFNSSGFNVATGTSAAAPIVSGAAMLLLDAGVANDLAVKALLLNTADGDGSWRRDSGYGGVNAAAAFDQRRNVLLGAVPPKSSRFFRGAVAGPARATLVWRRHVDASTPQARSPLNELAISLYRRDGTLLARADSPRDNVETLRLEAASGDYVVRVEAPGGPFGLGVFEEDFALAVTNAGLAAAAGPKWEMRCETRSAVASGSPQAVTCAAVNTGDIDLFQVTGSLLAPPGFSGGGPQSFGNLAAGQSRAATWSLTAASGAATLQGSVKGTAMAYGVAVDYEAALPPFEVVAPATARMTLDPAAIVLEPGSVKQVLVSAIGALPPKQPISVSVNVPWFATSLSGAVLTVYATDAARTLAAGTYAGQYSASDGTLSARGSVTLQVPAAAPAIESARVAVDVRMAAGCPAPAAAAAVSEAATAVYWFIARNAGAGDQMTARWFAPGVALVEAASVPVAAGSSCYAASLDPKRVEAARRHGEWKVELTWNGARQPASAFTVTPELRLTGGGLCEEGPDARRIPVCPVFAQPIRGQLLRLEFRRPDGDLDGQAVIPGGGQIRYAPAVPSAGAWSVRVFADGAPAGALEIPVADPIEVRRAEILDGRLVYALGEAAEGARGRVEFVNPAGLVVGTRELESPEAGAVDLPALDEPGRWRIRLSWDGVLLRTLPYDRLPARILEQALTSQAGPCGIGAPAAALTPLDAAARLWTRLEGAPEGAVATIEFSEGGVVRARSALPGLASAGSWCVSAALPVAGGVGARNPGAWEARMSLQGVELSKTPFEIRRGSAVAESIRSAPLASAAGAVTLAQGEAVGRP